MLPGLQVLCEFLFLYSINFSFELEFSSDVHHKIFKCIYFHTLTWLLLIWTHNVYNVKVYICANLIVLTFLKFLTVIFGNFNICAMNWTQILNIKLSRFLKIRNDNSSYFIWKIWTSFHEFSLMKKLDKLQPRFWYLFFYLVKTMLIYNSAMCSTNS